MNEEDVSQFDTKFTRQTPVDSPDDTVLSESANQVFVVRGHLWVVILNSFYYTAKSLQILTRLPLHEFIQEHYRYIQHICMHIESPCRTNYSYSSNNSVGWNSAIFGNHVIDL